MIFSHFLYYFVSGNIKFFWRVWSLLLDHEHLLPIVCCFFFREEEKRSICKFILFSYFFSFIRSWSCYLLTSQTLSMDLSVWSLLYFESSFRGRAVWSEFELWNCESKGINVLRGLTSDFLWKEGNHSIYLLFLLLLAPLQISLKLKEIEIKCWYADYVVSPMDWIHELLFCLLYESQIMSFFFYDLSGYYWNRHSKW